MSDSLQSTNPKLSFTTYKNYLVAYDCLIKKSHTDYSSLQQAFKQVHRKDGVDLGRIKTLLFNAWNSELLLNLPSQFNSDYLKFSNHWSPVQAYYALYLGLRSLIVSKTIDAWGGHARTLQIASSNLIEGEKIFPFPWSVVCKNKSYTGHSVQSEKVNPIHDPLSYSFDQHIPKLCGSLEMFLSTTEERLIDDHCDEWKRNNTKSDGTNYLRMPPAHKARIQKNMRPISMFDCLYRLRIRSNYKDADIYILGADDVSVNQYFSSLCNITDKTLFCIEHYVSMYIGKSNYKEVIDAFQTIDKTGMLNNLPFSSIKRFINF